MSEQMKQDNTYWIDESGNKWTKSRFSHDEAQKLSETMIDCTECIDCRSCISCRSCRSCHSCSSCISSSDCRSCISCSSCISCISCRSCISCSDCKDFKSNPQRITSKAMGSEGRQTTVYWSADSEQVVCGCWRGNLDELKIRVDEVHGRRKHSIQYRKWIKACKAYQKAVSK